MDLYPLDLVLATAIAWAIVFFAALPTRFLRLAPFRVPPAHLGAAWFLVAALSPLSVVHYYVLLALMCLYAWWQLRHGHALSGKGWLISAGALGLSLGVVLILAVTLGAYRSQSSVVSQLLVLGSVYLGGAIPGLASILHIFTRRQATQAGISVSLTQTYARLLLLLTFAYAATRCGILAMKDAIPASQIQIAIASAPRLLILPGLAWCAERRVRSPAPSTSGALLIALIIASLAVEIIALL